MLDKSACEDKQNEKPSNIEIIEGDLFIDPKAYSQAHCVSADFFMGGGIAVKLKKKQPFSRAPEKEIKTGGCAFLKVSERTFCATAKKQKFCATDEKIKIFELEDAENENAAANN